MNEKEQQKADKELLKELSGRFVKAYSDHEFKLLLEAQKRIIQQEEREKFIKKIRTEYTQHDFGDLISMNKEGFITEVLL